MRGYKVTVRQNGPACWTTEYHYCNTLREALPLAQAFVGTYMEVEIHDFAKGWKLIWKDGKEIE